MKNIQLISLTTSGNLVYSENNHIKQGVLQGFSFNNSNLARTIFRNHTRKTLQCKLGKNNNRIRLQNVQIYQELLKLEVLKINKDQLEQSKLFNAQEKQNMKKVAQEKLVDKIEQYQKKIIDYTKDNKRLNQIYGKKKKISGYIQFMSQQICLYFQQQGFDNYLPIKLRNIDHYFQIIQRSNFNKFLSENKLIEVTLVGCKFNLSKRKYQIQAVLPEQLQKFILSQGMGTIALKNINLIKPQVFGEYRKIQQQAKLNHKGIFSKPFQILSLIYTKNNLVAVVQQIIEGYIFKVRSKTNQIIKIQLAKIYCPIQNEAGAFFCRQFARKNLIGRQVNVFLTKDEGLNNLGSLVRLSDNKDIQTLMIQNGCGFVKQQLKGTMFYGKLQTLEKKSKELRKGVYNEKSIGYQFYEDFTIAHSKKQKLDKKNSIEDKNRYLSQVQVGQQGVIQKIVQSTIYVVRVDSHKKLIKVKLDGVSRLMANPKLPEVQQIQKQSQIFCYRNFNQRNVTLQLTQYDQINNYFVGIIRNMSKGKQKNSFQQTLLSKGLVILSNTGFFEDKWVQSQKQAKDKQIGYWNDKLKNFVRNDIFQKQDKQFIGKFSWVQDGQLAYVQPLSSTQDLDNIYESLNNPKQALKPLKQQNMVTGYICAAEYQKQLYRARIISISGKSVLVKFIDWGNKETIQINSLLQIPNQLQYIPPLCCQVLLDLVRPVRIKDEQHMEKLRQFVMQSECTFHKSYANVVNVYMKNNHLNNTLIYEGYLKADLSKVHDEQKKKLLSQVMNNLRKQLAGIWEVQSNDSDIQEDD